VGKITDVVRRHVPASYRAMCAVTNEFYSLEQLQDLADFVQFRLFATVVPDEETAYNIKERELIGILTTLQFIPAAVDYWGDQLSAQSAGGSPGSMSENVSYFDRRTDLWKVFDKLAVEAASLSSELGLFSKVAQIPAVSYGDNGRNVLITENPQLFSKAYTRRSSDIWSDW